ncbi:hypothetical protein MCAMS1_00438 [biofilm metagenome]
MIFIHGVIHHIYEAFIENPKCLTAVCTESCESQQEDCLIVRSWPILQEWLK